MADRERELLAQARRGLTPTAADAARVRRGVSAALTGLAPSSAPDAPEALGAGAGAGAAPWVAKLVIAGAIGAAGWLGYAAGHSAGVSEERARAPAVPVVVAASSSTIQPPREVPPPAFAAPAPPPAGKPKRAPAAADSPAPAPSAVASGRGAFDEEVIQLRRVQRALREGNARLALALLDDLDRAVPQGRLGEERAAANALARCALGAGPAALLASDFAARHPNSVYGARVAQACGGADGGQ